MQLTAMFKPANIRHTLLTDTEGNVYITYFNNRIKWFVQVFECENDEDMNRHREAYQFWCVENEQPCISADTSFDGLPQLLVVLWHQETKPLTANRINNTIRRVAQWYKYACLVPMAAGLPYPTITQKTIQDD